MSSPPTIDFFGTKVDVITTSAAKEQANAYVRGQHFAHIVTPNTEMIMRARRDPSFRAILNAAQLRIPDGIGLVWFGRWVNPLAQLERVSGADLVESLLTTAAKTGTRVVLLGTIFGLNPRAAETAAATATKRWPGLKITGYSCDPAKVDLALLQHVAPELLVVGFGAPQQDFWIAQHHAELPTLRLAIGAGASIDFLAGVQTRAPQRWQRLGLEWLWRLLHRPSRLGRQLAIPYFMWLMVLIKLKLIRNKPLR